VADNEHRKYPYLLRDWLVEFADEVWCSGIPYIAMPQGHAYLYAVIDWHSRKVLGWAVSNMMHWALTEKALAAAVAQCGGRPQIFNTEAASSPHRNGREGSKGWGSP
jgi:putative transposase